MVEAPQVGVCLAVAPGVTVPDVLPLSNVRRVRSCRVRDEGRGVNAQAGEVAFEMRCKCGARSLVRREVAARPLLCFGCRRWARATGRSVVLGEGGSLPVSRWS